MRIRRSMQYTLICILTFALVQAVCAEESYQVAVKAWDALAKEDWDGATKLADRAVKTWGRQARNMNRELQTLPKGDAVKAFANLNEVGTCLWIKGEALRLDGDPTAAMITYKTLNLQTRLPNY